jgi:hypothetical protein
MVNIGKLLVVAGLLLAALGGFVWAAGRLGIRRLPGDIYYQGDGVRIYLPIVTCLALSVLLTAVFWLWQWLGRR